jgi:hypothetical protein
MRQSLGDCTGQDVLSCIFLFFIKLYLGLMLGRLERLFALAEAGKLGPESPLAARAPRAEGGVASAAAQASAQRNQDLISGLWASFVGWASSNPSYGSAAGGSAEADPAPVAADPQADSPAPALAAARAARAPAAPALGSVRNTPAWPRPAMPTPVRPTPAAVRPRRVQTPPQMAPPKAPYRPRSTSLFAKTVPSAPAFAYPFHYDIDIVSLHP